MPYVFLVVTAPGFDPVWFGVIIIMPVDPGLIARVVGMNAYVINSIASKDSQTRIFRGERSLVLNNVVRLIPRIALPTLALFLTESVE